MSVTGAELQKMIATDYEKWKPIVERAKIPQP
jgi:tripartite-type tricarboxylate transporter receptor subunit TctC